MKIRFWDRFVLCLGALLVILTGVALIVAGLQFQGVFAENVPLWVRVLCIAWGVVLAAFGGYVIAFPRRYAANRHDFVVQRTDNGELRIAVKAIENLVQKCIDLHEEIHLVSMKILNGREGVVVDLCISLANNISIPLAVASLQKQIKQYLVASSGIEVKEVRVSVESTQDEPLVLETIEEEEAAAPEKAKEKKAPLHQRLFGKADQPAIVPEPPKAEEENAPIEAPETAAEEQTAESEAAEAPAETENGEATIETEETPASTEEPPVTEEIPAVEEGTVPAEEAPETEEERHE